MKRVSGFYRLQLSAYWISVNRRPVTTPRMVEAAGVELSPLSDGTQLIDSAKRQKRKKHQKGRSEVQNGYKNR